MLPPKLNERPPEFVCKKRNWNEQEKEKIEYHSNKPHAFV